jgi:two-component system sensor histidine kinase KdpD
MARGTLRLYLGSAPGVGKTFAMLNEGRRRAARGTDVVAGYVETHGRANTADQIGDLEVLPRRAIEYRGTTFEEMDLDALLERRPEVALVDELAHTNVPGSRNAKRWQDVAELLDAGIDVVSTLNIQHLESVNDVVERITGVRQQETIPDEIVRQAEQLELVDMTPEALRRRMAHGNIYKPEKIDAALTNYFRPGNLTALRELSLLWVADRVDESLEDYRKRHGIEEPWETRERVLVAITGAPGAEAVIRRAGRMAQRAHGELLGVHVRSDEGLAGPSSERLDQHRQLLDDLDGRYHEVVGTDPAATIVQFARAENCTQIVLGASRRSRSHELLSGSVINKVVRESGNIDVHVISYEVPADVGGTRETLGVLSRALNPMRRTVARRAGPTLSTRRQVAGWLLGLVGLVALTVVLTRFRDHLELPTQMLLYLLLVVIMAAVGGLGPALFTAVAGSLLLNWYFTPPIHTWTIARRENLLALVVFVVVAVVVSSIVSLAARRAAEARRARAEAEALARVAAGATQADPLDALVTHLRSTFALDAVAILRSSDGGWSVERCAGEPVPRSPASATLTESLGEGIVLALTGRALTADDRRVLKAFAAQLGAALERNRLHVAAAETEALTRANELRTALLQAVSHDLRTPLASIKASVSSLRQDDIEWSEQDVEEFLGDIEAETDRLNTLVSNLLDLSRLQAGVVAPVLRPVGLEEIVPAALTSLGVRARTVEVNVPETLPPVRTDPALAERVVANLVGNALAWSPDATDVQVQADHHRGRVHLRIVDHGPGIPADRHEDVLRPFQRLGDQHTGNGVGLGLAVANGFTRALEGELLLEDTPGGGLTAIVTLPEA